MARHVRTYLAHVYYPTHPRRAYGRRPTSRQLVEELPAWVCMRTPTDASASVRRVAVPMPRGGVRWLLECPRCQSRVTRLYARADADRWAWASPSCAWGICRACWGLGYRSQYQGRRPEADHACVDELRRSVQRTRDPAVRRRRLARVRTLDALRVRRMMAHDRRRDMAFTVAALPVLLREVARERRAWLRVLRAALREPRDQRAVLAWRFAADAERAIVEGRAGRQWPLWVAEVLAATLDAERVDDDTCARAAETQPGPDNLITQERLDAARDMYRAGTAPRQRKRAA